MKNKNTYLLFLAAALAGIIIYFTQFKSTGNDIDKTLLVDTTMQLPMNAEGKPADKNTTLLRLAKSIAKSLHDSDYNRFATYFHPVAGVRFSPAAFIDTAHDVKMDREEFLNAISSEKIIFWGLQDATGDSLLFTTKQYFKKYVYDVDFFKAPQIELNHYLGFSTIFNNLKDIYTGSDFVEFHFPGFEKKYEGLDWRSLRLVLSLYEGKYYLVGVVHDKWSP